MDPNLLEALRAGDLVRLRVLMQDNPNCLQHVTVKGNNALHIAAGLGHEWLINGLCNHHLNFILAVNSNGDTPLHCAARAGHEFVVTLLIGRAKSCAEMGVDYTRILETQNRRGDTALHEAVRGRYVHGASELIRAHPPLACLVNNLGESPLYLAAERGSLEVVQLLLQYAFSDAGGPGGQTALHAAVCRNHDVAQLLLEKRPQLNKQVDASQSTPLHYAVSIGDKRMVQLLLKHDVFIAHLKDKDGLSPIHIAASLGHIDVIEEIILHCPDASELTDKCGKNILHVAVEKKISKVVKYVLKKQALKGLINETDHDGNNPLHLATINHNQEIVHLFLRDKRVDTSTRNNKGLTPLDLASSCIESCIRLRKHKIMVELVSAGSQLSPQRMDFMTNKLRQKQEEEINRYRALANNLAIVAVLIATVTFAAAFTLPGGYKNDGSLDQGMAILAKKVAFKAFLVSDTVAMLSSITVTCLLIYTGSKDHDVRLHSISTAMKFMWVALGGMVVAFATGTYVVIASDCKWLANLICIMACCVPFIAWMVACWPAFYSLKLVKLARNQGRKVGRSAMLKVVDFQMPHSMVVDFDTPHGSKCDTLPPSI